MKLSDVIKNKIQAEYDDWKEIQYAGKDKKERQKLAQFFTPPVLTIRMLEKFDTLENKSVLDPTLGAGGIISCSYNSWSKPNKMLWH